MATRYTNEAEVSGSNVKGIAYELGIAGSRVLFNDVVQLSATSITATLSSDAFTETIQLSANEAYVGEEIVIIRDNRTSFSTTLASTSATVALTDNGFNAQGDAERRLRLYGYI